MCLLLSGAVGKPQTSQNRSNHEPRPTLLLPRSLLSPLLPSSFFSNTSPEWALRLLPRYAGKLRTASGSRSRASPINPGESRRSVRFKTTRHLLCIFLSRFLFRLISDAKFSSRDLFASFFRFCAGEMARALTLESKKSPSSLILLSSHSFLHSFLLPFLFFLSFLLFLLNSHFPPRFVSLCVRLFLL